MEPTGQLPRLRRRRVVAFRGRGSIYNWLRAHHTDIAPKVKDGTVTWPALCEEMARHGVVSRGGLAPSRRAAAKAWQTVCRDIEEAARARGAQPRRVGAIPPAHMSKDWRPSGFRSPAQPDGQSSGNALARPSASTPAQSVFRPAPPDDGRPPEPPPMTHEELREFMKGRGPRVSRNEPYDPEENLRRVRGWANVRSGLRWDDPGTSGKKA